MVPMATLWLVRKTQRRCTCAHFREMSAEFSGKKCYQLYRDYLDNFSINYERN